MKINARKILFALTLALAAPAFADSNPVGLKVGDKAPPIQQNDIKGKPFDLAVAESTGSVVIIFYRGGWCPYCNLQLHDLQTTLVPFAQKNHAQIVAISVDKATEAARTQAKHDLTMTVLSDPKADLLGAYKVQHRVSKKEYETDKNQYHYDIEKYSGETHHIIAIPAVYVVNPHNTIVYAHADPDFKVRAPEAEIEKGILDAQK